MGLRIGLKQTSSFVRLWEILMWYISLKFQYKNYFLNLWKRNARMMRAAEQGPKQESIRDWNIYWNLRLLCKIQRAQKKKKDKKSMGLREMLFICNGWTWKKFWCTAMADSPKSASIEKMCYMKSDSLWSWRYDWERCIRKLKGVSRNYLLTRTSSEQGWVGQFSGYVEAEVLLSRPDSKDLRDFARLPAAIDHGFEPRTSNRGYWIEGLFEVA